MTAEIKYLIFRGISKKEEILFKSFVNLTKSELAYQVVILKGDGVDVDDADILIVDEHFRFSDEEQGLASLPTVLVGNNRDRQDANYVSRPVQWSEFKTALTSLRVEPSDPEASFDRLLPSDVKFAISDMDGQSEREDSDSSDVDSSQHYSDEGEYEYELDKMSIDYHSFTNSDYVKVVDDVKQFKEDADVENQQPVILVTDDESNSSSSVLVIETNSMDAWELSDSDFSLPDETPVADSPDADSSGTEIVLQNRSGFDVEPDEEYWRENNEIIVDNQTLMFIKPDREMVYSHIEPGKWPQLLQRGLLSKAPIPSDWRPGEGYQVYPLSSLIWVNTLISATSTMESDVDDTTLYQLESWPNFDLLELDNILLKLCTMLFVRPESVVTLAAKSGYGRSTIRGLMNACYQLELLKLPEQISGERVAPIRTDEGMLGRIKDAFK